MRGGEGELDMAKWGDTLALAACVKRAVDKAGTGGTMAQMPASVNSGTRWH